MMKPQDIVVLLKLCRYDVGNRPSYSIIAKDLRLSASEVHSAVRRLVKCRLLRGVPPAETPNISAIEEFLFHGLKYVFPAERGGMTRGIPTSYAAEPLNKLIAPGNEPIPVWPSPNGTARGIEFKPLYKTVPEAAEADPELFAQLALVDALRDGRARERSIAQNELSHLLRIKNEQS
jgi:hypothetical protein